MVMNRLKPCLRKIQCLVICFLLLANSSTSGESSQAFTRAELGIPVLKWQLGGCYSSWCETGWYSSPAATDLDEDGQVEVIASAYSIFVINGSTGELEWKMSSG